MKLKPILFNGDMVKAILDGRKSVTRRIAKYIKSYELDENGYVFARIHNHSQFVSFGGGTMQMFLEKFAPYQVEDILYVREQFEEIEEELPESYETETLRLPTVRNYHFTGNHIRYIPSLHMPKEAARIFLKVTNVRVERLQDMPHDGALKEGIHFCECPDGFTWMQQTDMHNCYTTPTGAMRGLWNSTVKKSDLDRYGWDANPFCWVIEFERISKEEAYK